MDIRTGGFRFRILISGNKMGLAPFTMATMLILGACSARAARTSQILGYSESPGVCTKKSFCYPGYSDILERPCVSSLLFRQGGSI